MASSARAKAAFGSGSSRCDHAIDLYSAVSNPFQHSASVLTEPGRRQPFLAHATVKCVCDLGAAYRAFARVPLPLEEADIGKMRIGEQIVDRVVAGRWDLERLEDFKPLGGGPLHQACGTYFEVGRSVRGPRRRAIEAWIALEFRPADGVEEGEGLGIGVGANGYVAILGAQGTVIGAQQPVVACRPYRRLEGGGGHMLACYKRGHVFEHWHVDRLATSGLFAPVESKSNRLSCDQTGNVIGHHHGYEPGFAGRAFERASDTGE